MRMLGVVVLLAVVLTASAGNVENIYIKDGDHSFSHGKFDKHPHIGNKGAYFERNGVPYVIDDQAMLVRIDRAVEPQARIGNEQAELGAEQARIGIEQARLGMEQAAIGLRQATAGGAQARRLAARQRELDREQARLGEQQRPLGEKQRVLGEQQKAAAREVEQKLEALFEEAVRTGIARKYR
jgi:hypothetical protein